MKNFWIFTIAWAALGGPWCDIADAEERLSNQDSAANPHHIWRADQQVLPAAQLPELSDVEFRVIKPYEFKQDGYRFLHGVALAWHHDRLYASFGHNRGSENTDTEEARYRVSDDAGKTWSEVLPIDTDDQPGLGVSHGVFHSTGDKLWAFLGAYREMRKGVHTRAYTLDEATGKWTPEGVVVEGGFWPMTAPVKMDDGNWIMPGLCVNKRTSAGVAISDGDDMTAWKLVVIPKREDVGGMWGESTIWVDGPQIINICRYGHKAEALVAVSDDYGKTWTKMQPSNLPMVTSKPCAGTLSNGQRYLIATTTADSGNRRYPLTIAVSRPGEAQLSKIWVIRQAQFPEGPGESHPRAALSYPYAIEHEGKLYVGYSNNGGAIMRAGNDNSAELAIIPLEQLSVE
ncbi:exo-alpha-sialidase [Blastopirellula sp. J2-11]|uniref:exo-alpha-sialidase n=1 Tax=Blastopirellula sp. J2-11 TaxID=2943192 RepID=UPI0021C9FEE5|nr:exo-alpha-sialidase [Blastopirellula sp. J2-11]UUO06353.1 exo-alpha-sialidase [Blastopirellula sp. J2-11]